MFLGGRVQMMRGKSRHWWVLSLPCNFFLDVINSLILSYGLCQYISIPIDMPVGQFYLWCLVCYQDLEVRHHQLCGHFPDILYILSSSWTNRSLIGILCYYILTSSYLSSLSSNTCVLMPFLMNITHLWTHCNSWSLKSLGFLKIQSYYLLVTLLNSFWEIILLSESRLFLLG